jgi:hypothetical protein
MTKNELYYLILVCLAFGGFGISLALSCLQYRGWLARNPTARLDK